MFCGILTRGPRALALWLAMATLFFSVSRSCFAQTAPAESASPTEAPATNPAEPGGAGPAARDAATTPPAGAANANASAPRPRRPLTPEEVQNYHFQSDILCPWCAPSTRYPYGRYGLHWHDHWRHVGINEYVSVPLLLAVGGVLQADVGIAPERHARWNAPILFDRGAQDWLQFQKESNRKTASLVSDGLLYASIAQANVLDTWLVAGALLHHPDVAWQMTWINAQAYGLTLTFVGIVKHATARERPLGPQCDTDPNAPNCRSRFESFPSGHASMTATTAGLECTHHTQIHLYQSDAGDAAACLTSVAMMIATSMLRISSENHWASDVIVGDLIGLSSGYLVPTLIYYRKFRATPEHPGPITPPVIASAPAPAVAVLPIVGANTAGLSLIGLF